MNKFKIGDRVKCLYANSNQPIGTIVGIEKDAETFYEELSNEQIEDILQSWAQKFKCHPKEIRKETLYIIGFNKPTLNVPMEEIKKDIEFPNTEYEQEEFIQKFYTYRSCTLERDLILLSDYIPDYLPSSIA